MAPRSRQQVPPHLPRRLTLVVFLALTILSQDAEAGPARKLLSSRTLSQVITTAAGAAIDPATLSSSSNSQGVIPLATLSSSSTPDITPATTPSSSRSSPGVPLSSLDHTINMAQLSSDMYSIAQSFTLGSSSGLTDFQKQFTSRYTSQGVDPDQISFFDWVYEANPTASFAACDEFNQFVHAVVMVVPPGSQLNPGQEPAIWVGFRGTSTDAAGVVDLNTYFFSSYPSYCGGFFKSTWPTISDAIPTSQNVHLGFYTSLFMSNSNPSPALTSSMFDQITARIQELQQLNGLSPATPVHLTGHSLGAAEAVLTAAGLKNKLGASINIASVTTFGLPAVGDAAWAEWYDSTLGLGAITTSVWQDNDIIPISSNAAPETGLTTPPKTYVQLKGTQLLRVMTSACNLGGLATCPSPDCLTPTAQGGPPGACPPAPSSPSASTCFYDVGQAQQCGLGKTAGSEDAPLMCLDTVTSASTLETISLKLLGRSTLADHSILNYISHLRGCRA